MAESNVDEESRYERVGNSWPQLQAEAIYRDLMHVGMYIRVAESESGKYRSCTEMLFSKTTC